nr:ankyrin repeat domain-containing protein 6-like [Lytechinus pictus]
MASGSISALNERLRSSAGKGNWEEIEQLLRHGATFEADKYGRTALHYAAHYGQVKAIRVCIAKGCELDKVDTYGCTALHKAIAPDGHVEAVRALISEGCDVDGQDENGNTCVHEGAMNGFSQSLDVLVKIGKADIHTSNKNGQKAIHLSCQHGHNQSTRILLKAGSNPNIKNSCGETPIHIACLYGHITCARILISAECDINMKNKEGNTPLHIAAGLGKVKIAKLLLESQCEVKLRNKNNQTPLDLARQNDHRDVAFLIGANRMNKGKLSFFSRNKKKESNKLDGFGNSSHHHHSDSSPNDKHKRKHSDERRGDDDMDGGQGGARIRGRREMEPTDRHSSGSSKGKSKKKRDKTLIFCEGTRFTEEKYKKSQAFAKEKGLPGLKHHLMPRTKGFNLCMQTYKGKVSHIVDATIAYKDGAQSSLYDLLCGKKFEYHVYGRVLPLDEVPTDSEEATSEYCHELYRKKDETFQYFLDHNTFEGYDPERGHKFLPPSPTPKYVMIFWFTVLGIPLIYYAFVTLLSGSTLLILLVAGAVYGVFTYTKSIINVTLASKGSAYGSTKASGIQGVKNGSVDTGSKEEKKEN